MTVDLAIPPLTVKNRPCALNRACTRNQMNTVACLPDFAFLTAFGGKFFMTVALAIFPLTVKNRPCALIVRHVQQIGRIR